MVITLKTNDALHGYIRSLVGGATRGSPWRPHPRNAEDRRYGRKAGLDCAVEGQERF